MRSYSFGTFLVDASNRQAFELCRDISELRPVQPMPLILLADKSCGKTHLLYSIVNRVRASAEKTGLAYVTAQDFPAEVRALITDPSPVQRSDSAILLVNHLEEFSEHIEELEAVVRIFLDHGHCVVFASCLYPTRLQNLTPGLRELLENGRIAEIRRDDAEPRAELMRKVALKAHDELVLQQARRIEELEACLRKTPDIPVLAQDDGLDDSKDVMNESLKAQLNQARAELEALRREQQESQAARDELDHLQGEIALLRIEAKDAKNLRRAYAALEERAAELRGQLGEQTDAGKAMAALRLQMGQAQLQSEKTKSEAAQMLAKAKELVEETGRQQRDLLEEHTKRGSGRAEELDRLRASLDKERHDLQVRLTQATKALDQSRRDQAQLKQALEASKAQCDTLRLDLDRAEAAASAEASQGELAKYKREAEGRMAEAAGRFEQLQNQAAREQISLQAALDASRDKQRDLQAGLDAAREEMARTVERYEHKTRTEEATRHARLDALYEALDLARQTSQVAGSELDSLEAQARRFADVLAKLASRLALVKEMPASGSDVLEEVAPNPVQSEEKRRAEFELGLPERQNEAAPTLKLYASDDESEPSI